MNFEIAINEFNGPLDLMLHLIADKKLDLMNLDISELTTQYLQYLNTMEEMHLEVASEYLVELANLIEIKSRKLLPVEKVELEDNFEEDPQEKLVRRLIEYQRFKEVTPLFETFYEERGMQFTRIQSDSLNEYCDDNAIPTNMDAYDLLRSLKKMYERIALSKPLKSTLTVKEVSVDERRIVVRHMLSISNKKEHSLYEMLNACENMQECVITFVVLLDMATRGEIHFENIDQEDIKIIKGELQYAESVD